MVQRKNSCTGIPIGSFVIHKQCENYSTSLFYNLVAFSLKLALLLSQRDEMVVHSVHPCA